LIRGLILKADRDNGFNVVHTVATQSTPLE
jgi:hypothetical protein